MKAEVDSSSSSRPEMPSKKEKKHDNIKELFIQESKACVSPKRSTPEVVFVEDESDTESFKLKATLSIESVHQFEERLLKLKYEQHKKDEKSKRSEESIKNLNKKISVVKEEKTPCAPDLVIKKEPSDKNDKMPVK